MNLPCNLFLSLVHRLLHLSMCTAAKNWNWILLKSMLMEVQLLLDIHWVLQVFVFCYWARYVSQVHLTKCVRVPWTIEASDFVDHHGNDLSILVLVGARCVSTLFNEMKHRGKDCRFGVISMCIGT
jgi:hypothetical protein